MFNIKNYEYDCTIKCNCRQHANAITAALTKRSISNEKLAAFIAKTCRNFADNVDDLGRSAVHIAASVDRYEVLEWLLNQGAIINGRDFESGNSALHRAIYYGCVDCAVLLIRYGASLELLDEDTCTPLHNVCRLADYSGEHDFSPRNEVLVWGSNRNYNLGTGNEEGCSTPQTIEFFRKQQTSLKLIALSAYHTLFLDHQHHLYAVGHGKGGRLGTKTENSLPTPKKLKLPFENNAHIICMSVSRQHSLLLTNKSTVFATGINDNKQLGVSTAGDKLMVFKEVATLRDLICMPLQAVIAKDEHSIAYSEKQVFIWGANCGQFGMDAKVKVVTSPKLMKIPVDIKIISVVGNNCATVILTDSNAILLYYNYKMKSIKTPNYESIKSICVIGGDITKTSKGSASGLKLLVLTETNVVFIWYEITQNFYRCLFTPLKITEIDKIFYKGNQILLLSKGDIYKGKCNQIPIPQNKLNGKYTYSSNEWSPCYRTEVSTDHMIRIDVERIPHIDRATDIFCDDDFTSFAVLQESHLKYFKSPALLAEKYTFKKLFHDANEFDAVHDVVLHVDDEIYAAHKLILYARSPGLRECITAHTEKHVYLKFDGFTGKMLEIILKHIYTNYYPNSEDFDNIQKSLGPDSPNESRLVCKLFMLYAEKFQLNDLCNYLKSLEEAPSNSFDLVPKGRFKRLQRSDFPELYDVRIICGDNAELSAHKCILVARLEYFEMMFAHTWSEQKVIHLETVPVAYMEPILDFLYNCDVELFRKQNYNESFLYNMIVFCDQFFVERLRKICEIMILDKITIRKCGEMLDFAHTYNCEALKLGCLNFICQNLARVLVQKSLDNCDPDALNCINSHYRSIFKRAFDYRIITPCSEAVDDDLLYSFVDDFRVDLDYRMDEEQDALNKGAIKQKLSENKYKQSTRQHERDAIASMMKSLNVDDKTKQSQEENSRYVEEIQKTDEKIHEEYKSWMKVADKKEQKKKVSVPTKSDDKAFVSEKEKFSLIPLIKTTPNPTPPKRNTVTPEKITLPQENSTPSKTFNLSLADFTPTRDKLSQKQRKRLSSESSNWRNNSISEQPLPAVTPPSPPQQNAWNLNVQSPTSSSATYDAAVEIGCANDPNSFANRMRLGNSKQSDTASSSAASVNSFARILAEERKQREYYERMRSKSLILTQIEETAITELRAFYNVDNVTDEVITIERKPMPSTINFAQWQNKK
ncbi:inhibitor of Bruton tyrosine kinase-like [Teleopsis dalmanni]|uniref:inhibitor of Bruton tyrosine kinase-like n=1 Tax=Teleopsis dalmanni TaxID=139649 RepID=UPI0018CCDDD3|nr:inhibitor of Bruton tyrosine kinase-like [Teleopsis dalmanni]XP_037949452.1 inhibitor of Bruton tyrosine kinase-like [Teleopsis dalmanni]